jgi:hypothetical protein
METNRFGKFSNFEITSVRDYNGESRMTEKQNAELHAVPSVIVISHRFQDGESVFAAKSIAGVLTIFTSDEGLIRSLLDAMKDNVVIDLLEVSKPVENTPPAVVDTAGLLISELDFGIELNDIQLAKLKASSHAIITEIDRFDVVAGVFATKFGLATSVGKYVVIVNDEAIATKLATAFVTGKSVDLFEKLEG